MPATIGFFGKLPSHGDFLERRLPVGFREVWDDWLQGCLAESQRVLGGSWLDCYLPSPIWRFFLAEGAAGPASAAGVLVPSVDRVGRYFPFTVTVDLPPGISPIRFAVAAESWFGEVEQLCTDALQSEQFELSRFDDALAS